MKRLIYVILALLFVGSFVVRADVLGRSFDKIVAIEGGQIVSPDSIQRCLTQFGSQMNFIESRNWILTGQGPKGVGAVSQALEEATKEIPSGYLQIHALAALNNLRVYSDFDTATGLNPKNASQPVEVLVVWEMNIYGIAFAMYGTMTNGEFSRLSFGTINMNHSICRIQPMPEVLYNYLWKLTGDN